MEHYRPELDGLRAIAVLSVLLLHAAPDGPFRGGFIGVDLFFVLSSFLITSILATELREQGRLDLLRFYWRRFFRLMPALLLMLAGYLIIAPFLWPNYPHGRDALVASLYLSDYAFAGWGIPRYLGHTWSLAIEEHFYLVWPFVLPFLLRSRRPVVWLVAAFAVLTLWRTSYATEFNQSYFRFDTHATGLVLGAALYFSGLRLGRAAGLAALAIFSAIVLSASFPYSFIAIPPAEISSAVLIASAANLGFLRNRVLVWLGRRSYAIYLWHVPVLGLLRTYELSFAPMVASTLLLSISCAAVSWHTAEAWGRRMKSGWLPGRPRVSLT